MKRQEKRRILPNLTGHPERYFMGLQFVLLMLTMIYMLYLIFRTVNGVAATMGEAEQIELGPFFDRINFLLLIRIAILFVVVLFINVLLGLFYLHRLTGPLVRIRSVLNQVAEGSVPERDVILRKGDFPTDVARALTNALRRIREHLRKP